MNDQAHVAPGDSGVHVELIQAALIRLAYLTPADVRGGIGKYGPKTASAVLAYKRFFNIVNHAYQRSADNIVGKMTIAALDAHIVLLDSLGRVTGGPAETSYRRPLGFAGNARAPARPSATVASGPAIRSPAIRSDGTPEFTPPLSGLPKDMQETIWRSNLAKEPGTPSMYPFVGNHEGPLSAEELSKRFEGFESDRNLLLSLYRRMSPFGIWALIKTIRGTYYGPGASGIFCHLNDSNKAVAHMQALSTGPENSFNPYLNDISQAITVTNSRFCKDALNVHGERDSWREIVSSGPGLHICITTASGRARTDENYPASDFHIDQVQQGQFCSRGTCIPLINGQTIDHLRTVGPWLLKQPGEWLKKKWPFS